MKAVLKKSAYKKKKKKKKHFPPAKGNKFPSTPADPSVDPSVDPAEYEVSHIKNFEWKQGKALFTIAWEGTDENGEAWPDSVEPDGHLPELLKKDYFEQALRPFMMKWRGYHKRTYPNAFPDNKIVLAAEEEEAKTSSNVEL